MEFFKDENILPEFLNKDIIVKELRDVIEGIKSNFWYDRISLKMITTPTGKSFITPKFEIYLNQMNFKTLIIKELIKVRILFYFYLFKIKKN